MPAGKMASTSDGEAGSTPFVEIHLKPAVLAQHGLPDHPYPVASKALTGLFDGSIEPSLRMLLYWLQEYSALAGVDWQGQFYPMMCLLNSVASPREGATRHVSGDHFWLEVGPVDLHEDIITLQREGRLVAAIQPRPDGTLRIAAYTPLCSRAIALLTASAVRPGPDGRVSMRDNNWEFALDGSAGMGQIYAASSGIVYLSRWEFGMGISADGSQVAEWIHERDCLADRAYSVAAQIGIHEMFRLALDTATREAESRDSE